MVYLLEYQGVFLTYYYYLYDTGKINAMELSKIIDDIKFDIISIKIITPIRNITIQNKIKPMDMISPV
ncbi:unknown similar to AMEV043 [Adoxophyes honmai entomopoxvirus 'L']|uniref:Uncharacterized protein n=1 Tax=Adoxophyes honmai entomopoxvirus 'L' TaxID=1293540 RepID=A0A916P0R8_9POXV|nr:unknown similar to AMEV043 [Adoxophyes honmai entomopoxvirus 'L']CCU55364.1 unknown similar to AMEV043 [Adoxophyes honmai entomopoxvirus 'L']